MTTQPLTTQSAQMTTAAVEIKTLTVSGKQMTLAVFRQIQEERFESVPGNKRWGIVNYCPERDCGPCSFGRHEKRQYRCQVPHLHVVWQKGDELRRETIWGRCEYHAQRRGNPSYAALRDGLHQLFIAV